MPRVFPPKLSLSEQLTGGWCRDLEADLFHEGEKKWVRPLLLFLLIRMHIAVSRATSLLRIVGVEKEMRKDQRLAELISGLDKAIFLKNGRLLTGSVKEVLYNVRCVRSVVV